MKELIFFTEVIANSLEAGASKIFASYHDTERDVEVEVVDDGNFEDIAFFDKGCSSKKNHSGQGLYLLKQRCTGNVSIMREKNETKLKYKMVKDEEYGKLKSVLPLIFARVEENQDLVFEYVKNGKSQLIYSKDYRFFNENETILKIRNIVQNWD